MTVPADTAFPASEKKVEPREAQAAINDAIKRNMTKMDFDETTGQEKARSRYS